MATRTIDFVQDEFYHVYNRGVDKRTIFVEPADYKRFINLLYLCNASHPVDYRLIQNTHDNVFEFDRGDTLVSIGAYCLMSNHFHLLLTPKTETGLATFMNKLSTSYTMYFNRKHERSGSLFQGTYKAKHATSDEYLKYLYSYIHLNPIGSDNEKESLGQERFDTRYQAAATYQYSSLPDYLGVVRPEVDIIAPADFPEYFSNTSDIKHELLDWITYPIEG